MDDFEMNEQRRRGDVVSVSRFRRIRKAFPISLHLDVLAMHICMCICGHICVCRTAVTVDP